MLGICADDAASGVQALKRWVEGLRLPKGRLHGMDRDGVPLDMAGFGPVYIKYNSGSSSNAGDAMLNGYGGSFRGVYFSPALPDGEFRQYAVLPLSLFPAKSAPAANVQAALSPSRTAEMSEASVRAALAGVEPALVALGAAVRVVQVDASAGKVLAHAPLRSARRRTSRRPRAAPGVP